MSNCDITVILQLLQVVLVLGVFVIIVLRGIK